MSTMNVSIGLRLGQTGTWITCHRYPDAGPILSVSSPQVDVTMTTERRRPVSVEDVCAAHELLAAVRAYVAECERHCPEVLVASPSAPAASAHP